MWPTPCTSQVWYNIVIILLFIYNLYGFLYSGGKDSINGEVYDQIMEFHPDIEKWSPEGHMMEVRGYHAVSTINFEDVQKYCS